MEIQQLNHFLAAVRCGNFGEASEQQFITQSGLSRSINNLETRLGVQLFNRGPKGVTPTAFGEALVPHAELVINNAIKAAAAIQNIAQKRTGSVSIGVTLNYGYYFIPGLLCYLINQYPGISVDVHTGSFRETIDMLERGEVDLCFGLLDMSYKKADIEVRELFTTRSIVVARPDHPLANLSNVTAEQLTQHEWVLVDGPGFQHAFEEHFNQRNCKVIPVQSVRTNSLALLQEILQRANHLTVLPEEIVAEDIENNLLARIDAETPADYARAGLAINTNSNVTPAMEIVIELIEKKAASMYPSNDPESTSSETEK